MMSNCKFVSNISTKTKYKIGTYNIANSIQDEKSESSKFCQRIDKIIDTIVKLDCDILGINELRQYHDINNELAYPNNFLGKIKNNYSYVYEYMNNSDLSFANGQIYKRDKVFPVKTIKYWLSETPDYPSDSWGNGYGRILLGVKYNPIIDDKINISSSLWIYNVHLGLGEKEKNECVKLIPNLIEKDNNNEPFVLMGDFNFFDDLDGKIQRKTLIDSGMIDVGENTYFSCDTTKKCFGTFIGFDYDPYKLNFSSLLDTNNKPSRLDNIFCSSNINYENVNVFVDSEEQIINRETPSDHLPLTCSIIV